MQFGSAIQLFRARQKRSNPFFLHLYQKEDKWPFLAKMLEAGCIDALEMRVAKRLASNFCEDVAVFICHLFLAAKDGHLCIKIEQEALFPPPEDLWKVEEEQDALTAHDLSRIQEMVLKGARIAEDEEHRLISRSDLLLNLKEFSSLQFKSSHPIIRQGALYYFHKSWSLTEFFFKNLKILLQQKEPALFVNLIKAKAFISDLQSQNKLLESQSAAILKGLESTLTIITGGPGTGKTYTAGMMIKILFELLQSMAPTASPTSFKIAVAAPTGKAAANLEASITRALALFPTFKNLEISGKTLHQLLKVNRMKSGDTLTVLPEDVIIVDECSMIDAALFGRLLASVKKGARLILLGDPHQLPSVEAGSLFADMTKMLRCSFLVAELKKCMRSESEEIVALLERIKAGDSQVLNSASEKGQVSFRSISDIRPNEFYENLVKSGMDFFLQEKMYGDKYLSEDASLNELIASFNQFRILTPLRKGPFGSEAINSAIFSIVQRKKRQSLAVPIMITKNDYRAGLFNGEVGVLLTSFKNGFLESRAVFPSRTHKEPLRLIPLELLPKYELGYCLSIHKAQGSEFDHVALILPDGSESFGREGFYTGASRAKKRLEIWGSRATMEAMLKKTGARLSGL